MDNETETTGDSRTAACQFLCFSDLFEQSRARKNFKPNAVHIGASVAHTERKKKSLAYRVAHLTASRTVFDVLGSTRSVYDRITDTRARILGTFPDVGLVSMAYFLHNYEDPEERTRFLSAIREQLPESVTLCMDYTLNGVPDDIALRLFTSHAEHVNLEEKSTPRFLDQHRCFTLAQLLETFARSGWQYLSAAPLHAGRGLIVAGATQDPWEGTGTTVQELIRTASNRAAVTMAPHAARDVPSVVRT